MLPLVLKYPLPLLSVLTIDAGGFLILSQILILTIATNNPCGFRKLIFGSLRSSIF